jgi:CoA:oxalate CoA-transferase
MTGAAGDGEPRPLDGLVVLDLTRVLAGPYCTRLLSDLGARVIKVERPVEGDEMRRNPHQIEAGRDDQSTYFQRVNAGKESVAVDLSRPEGREVVLGLARHADVFIENFAPGVVGRLGLDYLAVNAVKATLSTARSRASDRPAPGGSALPSPTSSTPRPG